MAIKVMVVDVGFNRVEWHRFNGLWLQSSRLGHVADLRPLKKCGGVAATQEEKEEEEEHQQQQDVEETKSNR